MRSSTHDTKGPTSHHHFCFPQEWSAPGSSNHLHTRPQRSFNSASPLKVQSVPKSMVSSQDWEVTELVHSGRNGFLRTTKTEIRGKSQELLYQEKLHLYFLKKKKYSNHTEEKWVFSQARNKKGKWVKSCFWDDDAKIWLESIWHPVRQQNVFLKIHFTLSTRGALAIDSWLWFTLRNNAKPHRL